MIFIRINLKLNINEVENLYNQVKQSKEDLINELFKKVIAVSSDKFAIPAAIFRSSNSGAKFYTFDGKEITGFEIMNYFGEANKLFLSYNFFDKDNLQLCDLIVCYEDKWYTKDYDMIIIFARAIASLIRDKNAKVIIEDDDNEEIRNLYGPTNFNDEKQFNFLMKSTDYAVYDSYVDIGRSYESGCGVEEDCDKAMENYKKAYSYGSSEAPFYIALLYQHGRTKEGKKESLAFRYLLLGVIAHDSNATNHLGNLYKYGECGVPKNENYSFLIFEEGSKAGLDDCTLNLAIAYHFGIGTKMDAKKAIKIYESVQDVFGHAKYNLACIYLNYKEYNVEKAYPPKVVDLLVGAYKAGYPKGEVLNIFNHYIDLLKEDGDTEFVDESIKIMKELEASR